MKFSVYWSRVFLVISYIGFASSSIVSQTEAVNRSGYQLIMLETTEPIKIDGQLDEAIWAQSMSTTPFHKVTPVDEGYPISPTEVFMVHDAEFIYIAFICHDTVAGQRPVESLRRDFSFGKNDNFIAFIDTYNDQTNGFAFGLSAAGAQWDGIQADGGFVSLNWDTKWRSAVENYEDQWIGEMAIPLRSIRYKDGATEWGINFSRLDLKTGEKSSWAPVPRQFQTANLAFTGTLKWDQAIGRKGVNYSLLPYAFSQTTKNFESTEQREFTPKVGMDAKVMLSTSLNLDVTINPDFSQVEVDQQRTNLDRFELFFPERRQFFLENSDLFASLGDDGNRPFFSRRIGLNNSVYGGLRLSGKLGKRNRIGLMTMHTEGSGSSTTNFSVGVFQQQFLRRSNFSIFVVNKEELGTDDTASAGYNRIAGIDVNLASADNKWTGKIFHHQAIDEIIDGAQFTSSAKAIYENTKWKAGLQSSFISKDYKARVGFVQRTGILKLNSIFTYKLFPKNQKVTTHGPGIESEIILDTEGVLRDRNTAAYYSWTWVDRSVFSVSFINSFIKLQSPFDPTNSGGELLGINSEHSYSRINLNYDSGPAQLFNYSFKAGYGGYFNGDRLSLGGELSYRVQPFGKIGITANYEDIDLPAPYSQAKFLLVGPKLDVTFTDKIFLTTFVQYNDQIDNVNINSRLQWRFAPGSDFFIVYTHNALPESFQIKNNGLAVKMTYWFN